jgi:hypothetical protein
MKETAVETAEAVERTRLSQAVTDTDVIEEVTVNEKKPEPETKINIFINDDKYTAPKPVMTGAELKVLAGIAPENQLFEDAPGYHDDPQVFDDVPFKLKSGMKFYDVPVGNLGAR